MLSYELRTCLAMENVREACGEAFSDKLSMNSKGSHSGSENLR